ncbi:hypothetical protein [Thalassotalea sp. ND16A]|nr:hypothetical protein [Thalassotalea sp. ND16A]KGJ89359.1 hypothetical protein ND16A_2252 [Thalassotalea sp. ND16A]
MFAHGCAYTRQALVQDVRRYDCMDAESRATQDAKAENNAEAIIEEAFRG